MDMWMSLFKGKICLMQYAVYIVHTPVLNLLILHVI